MMQLVGKLIQSMPEHDYIYEPTETKNFIFKETF